MDTVLITGASGLLGSSLTSYLRNQGYRVLTASQKSHSDHLVDLSQPIEAKKILAEIKPSIIINLIGLTSVETCEQNIDLAYLINTRVVENIVQWIASADITCHLLHISTDHVYDGPGNHKEDSLSIVNNYALSKYAGELAAQFVPSTIVRTNFVGRSLVNDRVSLTDWVYRSLKSREKVQVLDDVYFSPISISLLCKMIELCMQKKPIGVFNVGSHNGMSKADFDFAFAEELSLPLEYMTRIKISDATFLKARRPKNMRMNNEKFENELGVKLPNLEDLIIEIALEYREPSIL
jgi:dTDP-4-dehydrorhamnose reductase